MSILSIAQLQGSYESLRTHYVKLLNDKEVLEQWGKPQLEALYNIRIGHLQIDQLQQQLVIRCFKQKIEALRICMKQNKKININEIELEVSVDLAAAEARILREVDKLKNSKYLLSNLEGPERSAELRQLYSQLAKQLHPEINDLLTDEQRNLWFLVKEAYKHSDLEKMKAIQFVYEKELLAVGTTIAGLENDEITLRIEVLKEGIKILQEELLAIKSEFPFTVEVQIKNEKWVKERKAGLLKESLCLLQYENVLSLQYHQMISVL